MRKALLYLAITEAALAVPFVWLTVELSPLFNLAVLWCAAAYYGGGLWP